jgi:hypothetical protein
MKKLAIICAAITCINISAKVYYDIPELLKKHNAAFEKIKPDLPNIETTIEKEYCGNDIKTTYSTHYPTRKSQNAGENYKRTMREISWAMRYNAFCDGFAVGLIAGAITTVACKDKSLSKQEADESLKEDTVVTIAGTAGLLLYKNNKIGSFPCCDQDTLTPCSNYFWPYNFPTVEQVGISTIGNVLGFVSGLIITHNIVQMSN